MFTVFLPLLLAFLSAGKAAVCAPQLEDPKFVPLVQDMVLNEPGLLGEFLKGCSFVDMVNLSRASKSFNFLVLNSRYLGLSEDQEHMLVKSVKDKDLTRTKSILGLTPKMLSRPLRITDSDELSRKLDLVTYAFIHGSAQIFEILVEKLGMLDYKLFKRQFECLPMVSHQLAKFQALEKQHIRIPSNPKSLTWIMIVSRMTLFKYLLHKGYLRTVMEKIGIEDSVHLKTSMHPSRYQMLLDHKQDTRWNSGKSRCA